MHAASENPIPLICEPNLAKTNLAKLNLSQTKQNIKLAITQPNQVQLLWTKLSLKHEHEYEKKNWHENEHENEHGNEYENEHKN